ncbi:hypothetical protein VNI00_013247 [Paramarasmius palmivorus]|uniref:G domain-containing protein n=1 Tax=Paramarasmius palmivorus TaxID=297713 RepID=A0AAW0BZC7_9AGAR
MNDSNFIKVKATKAPGSSHFQDIHQLASQSVSDKVTLIAIMGATGSGKTTFINRASGGNLLIGKGLESCTSTVDISPTFKLRGRRVTLIDTPGFDDTNKSDADVLKMIAAFLAVTYEQKTNLAGVIYLHRISDYRMGGISRRNFKMFKELCGDNTLKNVVIVTNMWGGVDKETGEAREAQLMTEDKFFKPVLDKGAQIVRHDNTPETARAILSHVVENTPLPLRIQTELVDQGKNLSETAAGAELNRELMEQIRKHEVEMKELQKEMQDAIRQKDEETRMELAAEKKKLQDEMDRIQDDSRKLASDYADEKAEMKRRMDEMKQVAEAQANRQRQEVRELEQKLRDSAEASAAERENYRRQLDVLRLANSRPIEIEVETCNCLFGSLFKFVDMNRLSSTKIKANGIPNTTHPRDVFIPVSESTKYVRDKEALVALILWGIRGLNQPGSIMGATGSGKTTFINAASGGKLLVGKGLESCTSTVDVSPTFELRGRQVTLIDTPGFDDTNKSDADILKMIAAFLATMYEQKEKLAGVIYLHRISDYRMGGISRRNFKMFRELCGDDSLKNVIIVTNMWGGVDKETGETREAQLMKEDKFFKPVLDKGAQIVRHDNTPETARAILSHVVENTPLPLRIQTELVDQGKNLSETAAGAELNRELMEQIRKHELEMKQLQEEMKDAIRQKDEETRRELEAETKKLQAEMNRVHDDSRKLASDYASEKAEMERRLEEMRQAAEAKANEQRQEIEALKQMLKDSASTSAAERERLQQQLNEAIQRLNSQPQIVVRRRGCVVQ